MPAPTITRGEDHFFVTKYEGNGGGQRVGKFVTFTNNGTIAKSCIFDSASNVSLTRTPGSAGNRKTFTVSVWVKRGRLGNAAGNNTYGQRIFNAGTSGAFFDIKFSGSGDTEGANRLHIREYSGSAEQIEYWTNRTFEDTSKFYHILVQVDTTQSTSSDRIKVYVDGDEVTSWYRSNAPSQDFDTLVNSTQLHNIGRFTGATSNNFDGYLAELNLVDGSIVAPSTFGVTDTSTGRWIPKSLTGITYGTNGFRMEFANSAGQTIGDDTSGNTNDYTVSNIATTDITTDSPTQNFITFGSADRYFGTQQTTEEGGLTVYASSGGGYPGVSANKEIPQSGKWYWEVKLDAVGGVQGITNPSIGVIDRNIKEISGFSTSSELARQVGGMGATFYSGFKFSGLLSTAVDFTIGSTAAADNDYVLFAFDMDNGKAWWGWNDSSAGSSVVWFANDGGTDGNPSTGANPTVTFHPKSHRFVPIQQFYAPGSGYSARYHFNFGQKTYAFTAPTGFSGLSQNNFPDIDKGKPDFIQIKNRDQADRWLWQDSLRGFDEYGSSASASPGSPVQFNSAITDGVQKSLKGGFQTEDSDYSNAVNESYVSFNWVANNGVSATDSSGNMDCELQANPTAGFSIAKFTVNGTGVRTWAHGLGKTPEFGHLWVYNSTTYGTFYHHKMSATPAQNYMFMSTSGALASFTNGWGTSGPSSTLWSGTEGQLFTNGVPYIFYSWTGIEGYSKFNSYVGNGSTDGPVVYLGFKPRYIWIKNTSATSNYVFDTVRFPNNPNGENVVYDGAYSEASTGNESLDFLSNGFKIRTTSSGTNTSGTTYIYGAFAEHPFIGDGTSPATAR